MREEEERKVKVHGGIRKRGMCIGGILEERGEEGGTSTREERGSRRMHA
jgi:hypothetical protein